MRLKVQCKLEKDFVNLSYNRKILSFFKKSLELYNKDIKDFYYNSLDIKDMSFSCFFPIQKIDGENIYLKENVFTINITFNSILDGIHYYNAFLNAQKEKVVFKMGENQFSIKSIWKSKEREIKGDVAVFKTLSPIVVKEKLEGKKEWYHLLDEKGIEILKKNLEYSTRGNFASDLIEKMEITPIKTQKTVVSFYDIKFPATKGVFLIKADRKLLDYFYKSGIGSKRSSGFGMLEIVDIT